MTLKIAADFFPDIQVVVTGSSSFELANEIELLQDLAESYLYKDMLHYKRIRVNSYFWRTLSQQEIDYIEEQRGGLEAWEFKWTGKGRFPTSFLDAYPGIKTSIIDRTSFDSFVL